MNRKPAVLLILGALLVPARLTAKDVPAPLQPGKYEDWNGNIDRMEIAKTFSLADYQRVGVERLDTTTTPLPPEGDKRRAHVINVLNSATDLFVQGMRLEFHPQNPTPIEVVGTLADPVPPAAPAPKTLLIRGRVTELNPGSKSARYSWVSVRSGHSDAEITGEILDGDSGEVLIRFMTGRGSSGLMSPAGGDYETLMSNDTRDDGANVGEMLTRFK